MTHSNSNQHIHTNSYLGGLSELAGRSFASIQEAAEAILQLTIDQTGLRSSFLTRISHKRGKHEVLVARNLAGGSNIQAGVVVELSQTF